MKLMLRERNINAKKWIMSEMEVQYKCILIKNKLSCGEFSILFANYYNLNLSDKSTLILHFYLFFIDEIVKKN